MSGSRSLAIMLALTVPVACSDASRVNADASLDASDASDAAAAEDADSGLTPYDPGLDAACEPGFTLQIDADAGAGVQIFKDAVPDAKALVHEIGIRVCRILYRKPSEVRKATHLTLLIKDDPNPGWKSGNGADITVMISTGHLALVKSQGQDVLAEIKGILHHEMTHMYQNDDKAPGEGTYPNLPNVIEGVADFVRIRAGFPPTNSIATKTGAWDSEGYWKPAFFLLWIDGQYPDFFYRLNLGMLAGDGVAWTPGAIETITGRSVDDLWAAYAPAACCDLFTHDCCK